MQLCLVLCVIALPWLSATALAQSGSETPASEQSLARNTQAEEMQKEDIHAEERVEGVVSLPTAAQMAMALSVPDLRNEALLDLAAASNALAGARQNNAADSAVLVQKFLDDRGWLARLVQRYGWVQPHSGVLDPAAWLVQQELQQHDLRVMSLVHPDQTPQAVLVYQVFQRAGERLAAANLPLLLLRLEAEAIPLWNDFLQLTSVQEALLDNTLDKLPDNTESNTENNAQDNPQVRSHADWKAVQTEWFAERVFPLPPEPKEGSQDGRAAQPQQQPQQQQQQLAADPLPFATEKLQELSQLILSAVDARPPDARRLAELRYFLLNQMSSEFSGRTVSERELVRDMLHLASLIDGLQDGRNFDFVQGLLAITAGLLDSSGPAGETPLVVDWLIAELPAISVHYADDFAAVDSRLNTAMTAVYKVLQDISGQGVDAVKAPSLILADAVAQLTLLIPDMGYYFNMPVRAPIIEEINICTSIAASRDDDGYPAMTRAQYDACVEKFFQLANNEIRQPELSGDFSGPFSRDTLRRELGVTPEQRINYAIGYLHDRYSSDCPPPATAMPNPLEWAVLATTMAWFAESSPEFFMSPENEVRLTGMRDIGEQLMLGLAEQANCFAGAGLNDPLDRIMADYDTALRAFNAGISGAEADFRAQRLRPGADVSLERDASQSTAYRPDDLIVGPCNPTKVCEMAGELSTTRALIGRFPDQFLLAEQSGLGKIEICYRNMEWVERRAELVRADDENVANYFGRLGFDLVGRYTENEQDSDLFAFRFTSPQEHHYLFAQASEDVLQDSCPVEWVGTQIITPLREDYGLVPDRLTYLAASRTLPSRLLQGNWDRGAEWRDWFVTGIGVASLDVAAAPDITTRLNQHLQSLYQAEQTEIYQRVLLPSIRNAAGEDISLYDEMSAVSIAKAMLHMQIMLFYPASLADSDAIRTAIAGDAGLLERRTLPRFREDNIALTSVNTIARERLTGLQKAWAGQPVAVRREGSISASLMHAMTRINIIYRQFFTAPPEPLEEIQVLGQFRSQDSIPDQPVLEN